MVMEEIKSDKFPKPNKKLEGRCYVDEWEVAWVCVYSYTEEEYVWVSYGKVLR